MKPESDALSLTFAALADPTRRAILARLAKGEATVNELAEPFALKLPTISKHLKVLQKAGLVSQSRNAQWRPCRLEVRRLRDVDEWVEQYRELWEQRFGQLDDYLRELQTRPPDATSKGEKHDRE
ncbi:MAG TPA: metalloregulator ArsR/SmtB family transcription factor [Chloroflexota bacterium]|nr:metalloregulator ArsR/SmtB family transcription factor [Chloroflexota bacterium]